MSWIPEPVLTVASGWFLYRHIGAEACCASVKAVGKRNNMSVAPIDQSQRAGVDDRDITQLLEAGVSGKTGSAFRARTRIAPELKSEMNTALLDFYLCPEQFVDFEISGRLSPDGWLFPFRSECVRYSRSASGYRASRPDSTLYDVLNDVTVHEFEAESRHLIQAK